MTQRLPEWPYRPEELPPRARVMLQVSQSWALEGEHGRRVFVAWPDGLVEEQHDRLPVWRATVKELRAIFQGPTGRGIYEASTPTGAKPGRYWLTTYPLPWEGIYDLRWRWNRRIEAPRSVLLACVVPIEHTEGGWVIWYWRVEIPGEAEVMAAFGWLRSLSGPWRCLRHGREMCRYCIWMARRGKPQEWQCWCRTCRSLPEGRHDVEIRDGASCEVRGVPDPPHDPASRGPAPVPMLSEVEPGGVGWWVQR